MDITAKILILAWVFCLVWVPVIISMNKKSHPKALFILFFAEMWERFSYYGMRTLLTLYMAKILFVDLGEKVADTKSLVVYGSYTSMVYLFPMIGGIMADRFLGFRKAIIFGGILMSLGHFTLTLTGFTPDPNNILFFLALALIVVGNGYFKPNISSFLGKFYDKTDIRKDSAFNIFYMGINVGALLSTITCAYVGEELHKHVDWLEYESGWHLAFGLAGIGMLFGLLVFWLNQGKLEGKGLVPNESNDTKPVLLGLSTNKLIMACSLFAIPIFASLLNFSQVFEAVLLIFGIGILGYLIGFGSGIKEHGEDKSGPRLWVVTILAVFNALFWALFEQAGGSLTLFADKFVDRSVFGDIVPASSLQSFNAFFIIILAPVFAWLWRKLDKMKANPSTPLKFGLAFLQMALGFVIIILAAKSIGEGGKIPLIFVALMYLFHTTGELSQSPIGLSMITKLSPEKIVGFVMGVWFVSFALANKLAGKIGEIAASGTEGKIIGMQDYLDVYLEWGVYVLCGAAALVILLTPVLRKWMRGVH